MAAQHPSLQPIELVEVGPRDGLQNTPAQLAVEDRVKLIEALVNAGHREVEVGSFVHPRWIPQMANTGEVFKRLNRRPDVRYWALVPNMRGLDNALDAGVEHIAVFVSSSETHNRHNLNRTIADSLDNLRHVTDVCRREQRMMRGYISTVFGCPFEGAVDFERVLDIADALFDMGVHQISLGDTTGEAKPGDVEPKLQAALERFGPERIALHIHDTRGVGLVIATLALRQGIRIFDTSVGGMGGCPYAPGAAGNLATEDFINLLNGFGHPHRLDLDAIINISLALQHHHHINLSSKFLPYAVSKLRQHNSSATISCATL